MSLAHLAIPFHGIDVRGPAEYCKRPRPNNTPEGRNRLALAINRRQRRGVRNLQNDQRTQIGKELALMRLGDYVTANMSIHKRMSARH